MWIAKFSIKHPCPILEAAKNTDIIATGYVLNVYEEDNEKYHTILNVLSGTQQEKFIEQFESHRAVIETKLEGNMLHATIKGEMIAQQYSKKLFYLAPVVHEKGRETWTLGATKKNELTKFYKNVQKFGDIRILQIAKKKPPVLVQTYAQLTIKQQSALKAAKQYGYYDEPRKITIKQLAEKLGTPRSTLQEHLRKAESKVLQAVTAFMPS